MRVVRNGRALGAIKEVGVESGRNPDEFALQPLHIGLATALAAGGYASEGVIKRKARWMFDTYEAYTRNNTAGSRRMSRTLAVASEGKRRQPGEGTVWGRK